MIMIPIQRSEIEQMMKNYVHDIVIKSVAGVDYTKGKSKALIKNWTLNLSSAGEQTVNLQGDFVYGFIASDTSANVDIQFSRKDSSIDQHNVTQGFGYYHPFDKLHISWDAQDGKTMTLIIGNLAPGLFGVIDNRSSVLQAEYLSDIVDNGDLQVASLSAVENAVRSIDGDTGDSIQASGIATNNTVVLHTVTADKTFYLSACNAYKNANGGDLGILGVRDDSDVDQYNIITFDTRSAYPSFLSNSFPNPIPIPAGWDIFVSSDFALTQMCGFITGWEE